MNQSHITCINNSSILLLLSPEPIHKLKRVSHTSFTCVYYFSKVDLYYKKDHFLIHKKMSIGYHILDLSGRDVYTDVRRRPTLNNLSPSEAANVNTPQELLDHCCKFPACYDPLYELCIDTCR